MEKNLLQDKENQPLIQLSEVIDPIIHVFDGFKQMFDKNADWEAEEIAKEIESLDETKKDIKKTLGRDDLSNEERISCLDRNIEADRLRCELINKSGDRRSKNFYAAACVATSVASLIGLLYQTSISQHASMMRCRITN